jgi:hypothetical protein
LVLLVGWVCTITLFYAGYPPNWGRLTVLAISSFNTVGNFAAFFQVAAASRLDGSRERIRMLPFLLLGFLVSTISVGRAALSRSSWLRGQPVLWQKTDRYRGTKNGNGGNNGSPGGKGSTGTVAS